jgi:hypothetical protein
LGKINIPFTEENYHIIYEEANRYKEKVDDLQWRIDKNE